MLVKLNIGKYRGDIIDMDPDAARRMVDQGNAEFPKYEDPPEKEESPIDPIDTVHTSSEQVSAEDKQTTEKPAKSQRGKKKK